LIPARRSHQNFSDPLGLVARMLRSGDRAALAALVREVAGTALSPLDLCLQIAEARRLRSAGSTILPLVLIVGAPRAGTTLVYQVLARYLPVTYFTNLSALFPRAPLTATRLFQTRSHTAGTSLHSYYGNTAGLAGPNDAFHVWNRWLGTDRYRTPPALDQVATADMRQFFAAWTETFGRPLLNKNNRNADCVALLGQLLPEAFFVIVRRDPVYVAQSLVIARQHIQGDKRRKWGLRSLDQEAEGDPLGYIDSVCEQILEIERKISQDQRSLSAARFIDVDYEQFCRNPAEVITSVSGRVWGVPMDAALVPRGLTIQPTNQRRVTEEEFDRIKERLGDRARDHTSMGGLV
jgi:hypothetical protein